MAKNKLAEVKPDKGRSFLNFPLGEDDKSLIQEAADLHRLSLAEFCRRHLVEVSRVIVTSSGKPVIVLAADLVPEKTND